MSVQMMMVRDAGAPVFFRRPLIALPRAHAVGFAIAPPPPPPPPCIQFHLPIPHFSHPAPISDKVEVRRVCRYNLKMELAIIEGMVRRGYRFASFDTEFPGTVVPSGIDRRFLSQAGPDEVYRMMRDNVNQTHIIQLGFTISDPNGRLPVVNGAYCCWEFNFRDFDVDSDSHLRNNDSIELLKRQGIDFDENKRSGAMVSPSVKKGDAILAGTGPNKMVSLMRRMSWRVYLMILLCNWRPLLSFKSYYQSICVECSPPINEVIKAGAVPQFVEFLGRQDLPQLQFEAAGPMTDVASGTSEDN
ncbi:uncharacterized protein LOC126803214 [Argentina anserina]|uniref:uncharacterized protein LOC126803213 n=1 Tax=Argentina anserina TaxID=57926 RepID=UPI00217628B7|nr:uncharacterized protein LOC126803212 isoform X3 [Potentilla anserina]XP_050386947.1 uncharacterized protein LOC126803213 [Potentilla anserina]XP_050386948.1 uncharacterized protein LOC126803214 [Potentilla anserina]